MSRIFTKFSEFSESDKLLRHEMGSIQCSCLSHVSSWQCGSILISHTRGGCVADSSPFNCNQIFFVAEFSKFTENI